MGTTPSFLSRQPSPPPSSDAAAAPAVRINGAATGAFPPTTAARELKSTGKYNNPQVTSFGVIDAFKNFKGLHSNTANGLNEKTNDASPASNCFGDTRSAVEFEPFAENLSFNLTLTDFDDGESQCETKNKQNSHRSASFTMLNRREWSDTAMAGGIETRSTFSERKEPNPSDEKISDGFSDSAEWYIPYADYSNGICEPKGFVPELNPFGGNCFPYEVNGSVNKYEGKAIEDLKSKKNEINVGDLLLESITGILWGWGFTVTPSKKWNYYIQELLAAVTVAFSMVPEVIAFGFIANIKPSVSLTGSWISSILAATLGGAPAVLHGTTGSMASIVANYVEQKCTADGSCEIIGMENLFVASLIVSGLLLIFSFFGFSSLIDLIPTTVIIGYCNGLSTIIALGQLHNFETTEGNWLQGWQLGWVIAQTLLVMAMIVGIPRIPVVGKWIPTILTAMVVSIIVEHVVIRMLFRSWINDDSFQTYTVGDMASLTFQNSMPSLIFTDPQYDFSKVTLSSSLVIMSILMFIVALAEALMIGKVIRSLNNGKFNPTQELFGVGCAMAVSSLFGGFSGGSMLAVSVLNYQMGGRGKESSALTGVTVLIILMALNSVINLIPLGALSGIMFIVASHAFKWFSVPMVLVCFLPKRMRLLHKTLRRKISRWDAVIILLVSLLCVFVNIAVAVVAGMVLGAFVFAWEAKERVTVIGKTDKSKLVKYYEVKGPLFFGTKEKFEEAMTPETDPEHVIVFLSKSSSLFDYSALEALISVKTKYQRLGKRLQIKGLDYTSVKMVEKAKHLLEYVDYKIVSMEVPELPKLFSDHDVMSPNIFHGKDEGETHQLSDLNTANSEDTFSLSTEANDYRV